jgi:hypothetical protein
MGFLDFLFGGDNKDASRAAKAENEQLDKALEELRTQFNLSEADLAGIREKFQPFLEAGVGQLGALEEGASIEGLDARLGRIGDSDLFGNLTDIRSRGVQGALGSVGLQRSGTAIKSLSAVPQDVALGIEGLLTDRSRGLVDTGFQAAGAQSGLAQFLAQLGGQKGSNIANIFGRKGSNISSGILGDAEARAGGIENLFKLGGTIAKSPAGQKAISAISASFLSDPRLKRNITPVGIIGDLIVCRWDWLDWLMNTFVWKQPTTGFLATHVRDKYPGHTFEFGGYLGINYTTLLPAIEARAQLRIASKTTGY